MIFREESGREMNLGGYREETGVVRARVRLET